MSLSQTEFDALLSDPDKRIVGDIYWSENEAHSPSVEFKADIESDAGYPLIVVGGYNPLAEKVKFALIHRAAGRIYALDLGSDHRNPDGNLVGEIHKHTWTDEHRDKKAYVPRDITARPTEPLKAWEEFCDEANIKHEGDIHSPPPAQLLL